MNDKEQLQKGDKVILKSATWADYRAATYIESTGQRDVMGATYHRLRVIDADGNFSAVYSSNNFWPANRSENWLRNWKEYKRKAKAARKS